MPQKSSQNSHPQPEEQQSSAQQKKIIPISRNSHKREQVKYNKPHCIIPVADMIWVLSQAKSIQNLWNECWTSDQYGSRWIRLTTSLSEKAFRVARQALSKGGLFEFKRETCTDDTRKTAHWLVKNLHGARRIQEFWLKDDDTQSAEETAVEIVPISGINEPNNGQEILNVGQKMPDISPETLEKASASEPLSNSSLTPQELLKEVPEAKEVIHELELALQVPTRAETIALINKLSLRRNSKNGEKIFSIIERCQKKAQSSQPELSLGELFTQTYKWKIDNARLQQLHQLTKELKGLFLEKFDTLFFVYRNNLPEIFDWVISGVRNNTSSYQPTS